MKRLLYPNQVDVKERIEQFTGMVPRGNVELVENTTDFMNIYRGQVLRIDMNEFYIMGDVHEPRFGMQDTPKFWVKKVIDLDTGETKLLKLVFHEEFVAKVGHVRIHCSRNPDKESRVLELTQDDERFMDGSTVHDVMGNNVRILNFIHGETVYNRIMSLDMSHEDYFHTLFPAILNGLVECMDAIRFLHQYGLCHGDVRNDHIIIERGTGLYRWIDFDLDQNFADYDVWSFGNLLSFCAGKGMNTFRKTMESELFSDSVKASITPSDASAFYKYRIINLKKLYAYIPQRFNDILMRFAVDTTLFYDRLDQLISDVREVIDTDLQQERD